MVFESINYTYALIQLLFVMTFRTVASKRQTEALASVEISCFLFSFCLFVCLFFAYVLSIFSRKQPQQCNHKKLVNQYTHILQF